MLNILPRKKINDHAIVTVVTPDFFHRGLAAMQSAKKHNKNCDYYILYLDHSCPYIIKNIKILTITDITEHYSLLKQRYPSDMDKLRWSLKSVILLYLLNFYYKVIYIDPDIFFVNSWNFLYESIDSILLSPHYFENKEDLSIENTIKYISQYGYFNAGFIGASRYGTDALRLWSNLCYKNCTKDTDNGLYDDQKYLELIFYLNYVFNKKINVIDNFGCNIAPWNLNSYLYSSKSIFCHFSDMHDYYNRINIFKFSKFVYYHQYYVKLANKIKKCILKK